MKGEPTADTGSSFSALLEAVPDAMVVMGEDGRVQLVNEQTLSLFGYTRDELVGQPIELLLPERFRNAHRGHRSGYFGDPRRRPMSTGRELFGRRKDGTEFPAEISLASTLSARGIVAAAVIRDITERKRADAVIVASEARYQSALDNMLEAAQIVGFDWQYLYLNDAAARNGRQPKEEMLGRTLMERYPGIETTELFASLRRCMEERTASLTEFEFTYPDDTRAWFEFSIQPVPEGLFILSLDVTARKRVDQEIRALNADLERRVQARTAQLEEASQKSLQLASIVASSDDAIIGTTLDGVVTSWNQGAERVFGYSAVEIMGKPSSILLPADRGDENARMLDRLRNNERIDHFESVRRRKDGREIDVSISISSILDSAGTFVGISKIARDVTEAKRNQESLARAKHAAEAANRELESFSYSVAHDLRAPLRSIDGFSQALLDDYLDKLDADGKRYLSFIRESAQQMAQLIDDLLALSRVTRSELSCEEVDLSALARAGIARLQRSQPDRSVAVVIQEGLTSEGDRRLLGVALDNLLGNAWKFTGRRDEARIDFGATSKDGHVVYFVRDNGVGFDMAFVSKLFGVFQRLHAVTDFEGTGVGLATVQRVVRRHGGRVWAEGRTDGGATFYFTLQEKERVA